MPPVADIFGQTPADITAWATIALAFVGAVGIVTGTVLAIAAHKSLTIQRQELDNLKVQLQLASNELALRSATREEERARAERDARANLDLRMGANYSAGAPPRNVEATVVVTNNGPGIAVQLVYGVRRRTGNWEGSARGAPLSLGVGASAQAPILVPDDAVADCSFFPSKGDPVEENLVAWARYVDATGKTWEIVRGEVAHQIDSHLGASRAEIGGPDPDTQSPLSD